MPARSLRTCIGCRRTTSAGELIRLVLTMDGDVAVGNRGGRTGRGASIHRRDACVKTAIAQRSFARAFRGRPLRVDGPELASLLLTPSSVPTSPSFPGDDRTP